MSLFEFVIKCPVCKTATTLIAYESNPLIFQCHGCYKNVVMQGTDLYTVSNEYIKKILSTYKSIPCGHVVGAAISEDAKELITEKKIRDLHMILSNSKDVNDILNNI